MIFYTFVKIVKIFHRFYLRTADTVNKLLGTAQQLRGATPTGAKVRMIFLPRFYNKYTHHFDLCHNSMMGEIFFKVAQWVFVASLFTS